ncbi:hypothetical protein AWJ20_3179 [Sugiyamaella lignohabitans]|uniref:Uncharacterized protein n=1 Tax=Sugiyamaella lignohabitans TaxID=796027 RepID=A0A167FPW8_9ASCO|nr:uncharacterized protein AWJ20_3179 [Sugiyamaella lignohabitans]ANB15551.1 hypothetical protein AWJ20_3179 [Sugiyamaella lignohabitans]
MRFEFWKSAIQKVFASVNNSSVAVPSEPVALLLAHCLGKNAAPAQIELSKRFFITILQTRETYAGYPPFRNLDAMASYGEGTYSQLNYLTQEALYSISPTTSKFLNENPQLIDQVNDIVAHIGQATGITSMLRGFPFFVGAKGFVPLPVDLLTKHNISQESILQAARAHQESQQPDTPKQTKLELDPAISDIVFETATRANDHLISASTLFANLKSTLDGSVPDAIFVPTMTSIPAKLFLEKLEKCNFDPVHPDLTKPEWRLPFRSYVNYRFRKL